MHALINTKSPDKSYLLMIYFPCVSRNCLWASSQACKKASEAADLSFNSISSIPAPNSVSSHKQIRFHWINFISNSIQLDSLQSVRSTYALTRYVYIISYSRRPCFLLKFECFFFPLWAQHSCCSLKMFCFCTAGKEEAQKASETFLPTENEDIYKLLEQEQTRSTLVIHSQKKIKSLNSISISTKFKYILYFSVFLQVVNKSKKYIICL